MRSVFPGFPAEGLAFFSSLQRNNRREWFQPRKAIFEASMKQPMRELVVAVNSAMKSFAPEYVTDPDKAIYRIYRDTRFSSDKRPYKPRVAAWWSPAQFAKTSGAGFYAHIAADGVVFAAGNFMPPPDQLLAIRRHLQQNHEAFRAVLADKKRRKLMPDLETDPLKRVPKGFAADDPAADYIRDRKWGIGVTLPASIATTPALHKEIIDRMRSAAPLVDLLNAPLLASATPRKTFF